MDDKRIKLKMCADAYRNGIHEHFWLCLKEDLNNLVNEKRNLACKYLSKGQVDDAKRQNYMADAIQEVVDRPRYVIDITSSISYEICRSCGNVVSRVKNVIDKILR